MDAKDVCRGHDWGRGKPHARRLANGAAALLVVFLFNAGCDRQPEPQQPEAWPESVADVQAVDESPAAPTPLAAETPSPAPAELVPAQASPAEAGPNPDGAMAGPPAVQEGALAYLDLPVCDSSPDTEPLSAICRLNSATSEFPGGCNHPQVIMFCDRETPLQQLWGCVYSEERPRTIVQFMTEAIGPIPYRTGRTYRQPELGDSSLAGVRLSHESADEAAAETLRHEWVDRLQSWGCVVVRERAWMTQLTCQNWEADVSHQARTQNVTLDAALPGMLACWRERP